MANPWWNWLWLTKNIFDELGGRSGEKRSTFSDSHFLQRTRVVLLKWGAGVEDQEMDEFLDIRFYRTWFEFLKLSDYSNWNEYVREHLAPIGKDLTFEAWWKLEQEHFRQSIPDCIFEVASPGDYSEYADDPGTPILAIELCWPKEKIRTAFENFLDERHEGKSGPRPKFDCAIDLPMAYIPEPDQYDITLKVYNHHLANPDLLPEKIEDDLDLIPKNGVDVHPAWETDGDYPASREERKKVQIKFITDHIRAAEEVKEYVVCGIFPPDLDYKDPKTGLLVRVPFKKIVAK